MWCLLLFCVLLLSGLRFLSGLTQAVFADLNFGGGFRYCLIVVCSFPG